MFHRTSLVLAAALAAAALACSKSDEGSSSTATLALSASPERVQANAVATVTITVLTGSPPVLLSTTRGAFENGRTTMQLATVPGSVLLLPCDARLDATCAGPARVAASDTKLALGSVTVQFDGFEVCTNGRDDNDDDLIDCADPQCPLNVACNATGMVCGADRACSKCTPAGGVSEPAAERTCGDGVDNDCDGTIDCADADCAARTCQMGSGAAGVCTAGACSCSVSGGTESVCSDGVDDDCDGLVDCADPDCVGDVCDTTRGLVCPGSLPRTCGVCPTGQSAESAAQCGDGKDNDCDGVFDCADSDCQPAGGTPGGACNAFGGRCILTSGVPSCGCPSGATTETACSGGVDDDCDGKVDCADDDCQPAVGGTGQACGAFGQTCTAAGTCACAGTVEVCDNYDANGQPVDDDCDGRANCQDFDCRPKTPGAAGSVCSAQGEFGKACDATGACVCTGNGGAAEVAELSCDDGFDNDCDFLVDCQDPDCGGRSCGPAGAQCAAGACACPGGTAESSCSDGIDNDCDGKIDCEEASCATQACDAGNATLACILGACVDPATQYAVTLTPARGRLPAVAGETTTIAVNVRLNGVAKAGLQVDLALDDATLGAFVTPEPVTTDSQGNAAVTFRSSGAAGTVTVTGTVVGVGATGSTRVEMPAIGEIRVATGGVQYTVMGVRTSGYREQNLLRVEVLDTLQRPYPAGLQVVFEHRPLGGSTLSSPLAAPACAELPCVQTSGVTDASGGVSASLYSGTVAGSVHVSARAAAGGLTRVFDLPSVAIVGARANAGHFSIVCGPDNIPALANTTCHVSTIDAPFTCVALLKDRFNNVLGRPTLVSFLSEAGSVGPPSSTPQYEPGGSSDELGLASVLISTLGGKLPKDVAANADEASVTGAADRCGIAQRNPRDGLVTVVGWTTGEEAFHDANANGRYDLGEPFIDLPEPFVDYDDDDDRDADEPFVDTDADGSWDGPNGTWDGATNVWAKTTVLYTGMPAYLPSGGQQHLSRWMTQADAVTYPLPTPTPTFSIRPAFPAVDVDGDGTTDIPAQPPTFASFQVAASDMNLNRLAGATTYAVRKPASASFSATYNGLPSLPNRPGLDVSYQPCRSTLLTSCALDCADVTTVADSACWMRTRVGSYSYGYGSSAVLKGGGEGSADGSTEAFWDVTLFGETLSVPIFGTHQ